MLVSNTWWLICDFIFKTNYLVFDYINFDSVSWNDDFVKKLMWTNKKYVICCTFCLNWNILLYLLKNRVFTYYHFFLNIYNISMKTKVYNEQKSRWLLPVSPCLYCCAVSQSLTRSTTLLRPFTLDTCWSPEGRGRGDFL